MQSLRLLIATLALSCGLAAPGLSSQGSEPAASQPAASPLERWNSMTPEQRDQLQRRFDELRSMSQEQRDQLHARALELKAERQHLEQRLGLDMRDKLGRLAPEERDRVLREHQLEQHRHAGALLREGLGPDRAAWVEGLVGSDRPRPFHDLRRELCGKVEDRLLERWHAAGELSDAENQQLGLLPSSERGEELLRIHRARIEAAVEREGLPAGVDPQKWQQLQSETLPERFLKRARKLGLDQLAPPPGAPPGGGGFGPPPLVGVLMELLHPTFADRIEFAKRSPSERHSLIEGRVAERIRARLADPGWLPELDRTSLTSLGDGELLDRMRALAHEAKASPKGGAELGGRPPEPPGHSPGPRAPGQRSFSPGGRRGPR